MKSSIFQILIKIVKWVVIVAISFKIIFYMLGRFEMKNTIEEKSGVEISFFFNTIENDVFHTPSAFDSDYTWDYKLQVSKSDLQSISNQIKNSKFYDSKGSHNFAEPIYDSLRMYHLKGYWSSEKDKFEFYPAIEELSEMTNIEIDKKERTIKVHLVHL